MAQELLTCVLNVCLAIFSLTCLAQSCLGKRFQSMYIISTAVTSAYLPLALLLFFRIRPIVSPLTFDAIHWAYLIFASMALTMAFVRSIVFAYSFSAILGITLALDRIMAEINPPEMVRVPAILLFFCISAIAKYYGGDQWAVMLGSASLGSFCLADESTYKSIVVFNGNPRDEGLVLKHMRIIFWSNLLVSLAVQFAFKNYCSQRIVESKREEPV